MYTFVFNFQTLLNSTKFMKTQGKHKNADNVVQNVALHISNYRTTSKGNDIYHLVCTGCSCTAKIMILCQQYFVI